MPKSRQDYWIPKISRTVERDAKNQQSAQRLGWKVIVVWECELKKNNFDATMHGVVSAIKNHKNRT